MAQPTDSLTRVVREQDPSLRLGEVPPIPFDPREEYVVGGSPVYAWLDEYYQALPPYIDDLTRDFGDDIYERMMLDSQVSSCVHVLKMAILQYGLKWKPPVPRDDPTYKPSLAVRDQVVRWMEELRETLYSTLYNMLDAMTFGNKVAELVCRQQTYGPDSGKLVPKSLKVKPRRATIFITDNKHNVYGLVGWQPNMATPSTSVAALVTDPRKIPGILPKEKFLVFTYRKTDEDPRGRSILRPAYTPWWNKLQVWPEYLKYLSQFADPSLIGELPPNAVPVPKTDPKTGEIVRDTNGNPIMIQPAAAMLQMMANFRGGSAMVHANGGKVTAIEVKSEGAPFTMAIDLLDRQISKAITGQTLATEEGLHMDRASSSVHQDILGMVVLDGRSMIELGMFSLARRLVMWNLGPESVHLTPHADAGQTEKVDLPSLMRAIAAMGTARMIHPSQLQGIDELLGIPVRPEEAVADAEKQKDQEFKLSLPGISGNNPQGRTQSGANRLNT